METYIGFIGMYGFNWAPRQWSLCNGQLLAISSNTTLFSLLGTTFGGDGRTTFALPDLRGRVPVGQGHGPGLTNYRLGQAFGHETQVLTEAQLPSHTHTATAESVLYGETAVQNSPNPKGRMLAGAEIYADPIAADNKAMASDSVLTTVTNAPTGGSQPVDNRQPALAVNFSICMEGLYPPRS